MKKGETQSFPIQRS